MKITTTLEEYIKTELVRKCYDEFFDVTTDQIRTGWETSIMGKIVMYDPDVQVIVNGDLFSGLSLDDPTADLRFKKGFINKFLDYEIGAQTIDLWRSKMVYEFLTQRDYINTLFTKYNEFLTGGTDNTGTSEVDSESRNNSALATLPQDNVQLDLDAETMAFADSNGLARAKGSATSTTTNKGTKFDPNALNLMIDQMEKLYKRMAKRLFILTW